MSLAEPTSRHERNPAPEAELFDYAALDATYRFSVIRTIT